MHSNFNRMRFSHRSPIYTIFAASGQKPCQYIDLHCCTTILNQLFITIIRACSSTVGVIVGNHPPATPKDKQCIVASIYRADIKASI